MDRLSSDADPDPTFSFDADPDPDPTPSFTNVGKSELFLLLFRALPFYFILSFSSAS